MKLKEWEIWHTYTSYVLNNYIDLETLAYNLVKHQIGYVALHSNGLTYWRNGDKVGKGYSKIEIAEEYDRGKVKIEPIDDSQSELKDFSLEAWYEACYLRFCEKRVFGSDELPFPHNYIRVFLGQCNFIKQETVQKVKLYPIAIVYETGVVIIEMRSISPDNKIDVDDFINRSVNLFRFQFDQINVSPGLSKYSTIATYRSFLNTNIFKRIQIHKLFQKYQTKVDNRVYIEESGDFNFELAPLFIPFYEEDAFSFSSLAHVIFQTIAFFVSKPIFGFYHIILGQKKVVKVGNYWSGRPHIHITQFDGQKSKASENEKKYRKEFGSIMMRISNVDPEIAKNNLPIDTRLMEDYNSYINRGLSLWVWSLEGLKSQEEWKNPNQGYLIYEHQALVELIEYLYSLHRSLLEQINNIGNNNKVLAYRRLLVSIEEQITDATPFGEIKTFLENGWKAYGLYELKENIRESLEISEAENSLKEGRKYRRLAISLTILFGLFAIPLNAEKIINQIWDIFNLCPLDNKEIFLLIIYSVPIVGILIVLWFIIRIFRRR